jgi:hypothetical protein
MLITLPHGLIDGPDLFDIVDIDELRGKQQNYLADKELVVNNIGHIPKILGDMILSFQTKEGLVWKGKISDAIWKITSSDIETILIKIRENTYGSKFYHEADCSHCNNHIKNLRLDLDKLEIKKLSNEQITSSKILKLPKSGIEVELKPMYLKDMFDALKIITKNTDKLITSSIALGTKRLGNKSPVSTEDIENIPASDLMFLNGQLDILVIDGSIDTNIELNCEKCKNDFNIKLNCLDPSFFVPSKASMN